MLSAFLITLREGLEAALILAIILAYLAKSGAHRGIKQVWLGAILAGITSLSAGAAIYFSAARFEGRAEAVFEGVAMLVAFGMLTWMVLWMQKQAANIRGELQNQVQAALISGSLLSLFVIAFIAVVREGIETVLFLFAASRTGETAVLTTAGAFAGLVLAALLGYAIYKGTARLNLRLFFNITGVLLIVVAAGLLAHGIHEFHEAGLIPPVVEHVWDTNNVVAEQSLPGRFLTALFGYNANPSLVEAIAYFGYLGTTLYFYLHRASTPGNRLKRAPGAQLPA